MRWLEREGWIRVNVAPENVGRLGFYANSVRAPCFDGEKVWWGGGSGGLGGSNPLGALATVGGAPAKAQATIMAA